MPLRDQDGNEVEQIEVVFFEALTITRALIEHGGVSLYVDEREDPALRVSRPTHPGAVLAFDVADWVGAE